MKLRYRILILAGVFLVSLIVFFSRVSLHTYSNELKTVAASQATLPVVSFRVGNVEVNPTLGYTFEPEMQILRECVTPIGTNMDFEVLINEYGSVVKKLVCEVIETQTLTKLDTKEVKALKRTADGRLSANVVLTGNIAYDTEYSCKLTLTTGDGRDVYYYSRLVVASTGNLKREMDFVMKVHDSLLDEDRKNDIEKFLDTVDGATGADFSHVSISDNLETVSYGTMSPKQLEVSIPKITEYNSTYVCVVLDSEMQIYTNDAEEKFRVREDFRLRCQGKSDILFSYDRTMQSEFDGTLVSINRNQIKLGLTPVTDLNYKLSDNNKYLLFVYDGNLWEYDMTRNTMVQLFTFDREGGDTLRYRNGRHDFKLISVEDDGNADFVFYGYISRGQYEGRVGILYYRYHADEGRIEEMMFVPVTVPYEILKEEFGALCYMNDYDEFYFTLYDTLYLYRTLVHDFTVVVEHMPKHSVLFEKEGILVYQDKYAVSENKALVYYDLENRKPSTVSAAAGDRICLLGEIDGELIYGLAHAADMTFHDNGTEHVPMYRIVIEELDGTVVKTYDAEEDLYSSAEIADNAINIDLCRKTDEVILTEEDGTETVRPIYEDTGKYNILKSSKPATQKITVTGRSTTLMRREYYMNLPSGYKLEGIPKTEKTVFTVLTGNTSVRVGTWIDPRYYVIAYGRIQAVSDHLGECIKLADDTAGCVYDGKGNILWKRGIKPDRANARNVAAKFTDDDCTELQAILQMFLSYKGSATDATTCDMNRKAFLTWLTESIPGSGVDISGVTLSEALQFIADGRPVAARYKDTWVLIIGYEAERLTVISPTMGRKMTISISDAKKTIEKAGVYFSYID